MAPKTNDVSPRLGGVLRFWGGKLIAWHAYVVYFLGIAPSHGERPHSHHSFVLELASLTMISGNTSFIFHP